jgi:hypothetical protein
MRFSSGQVPSVETPVSLEPVASFRDEADGLEACRGAADLSIAVDRGAGGEVAGNRIPSTASAEEGDPGRAGRPVDE